MHPKNALKPNLLVVMPPYAIWGPPAGAAALLGYLKAAGCDDFSFLDVRLFAPDVVTPTYRPVGAFGETYVLDVPDLPLVLAALQRIEQGEAPADIPDHVLEPYCEQRGLNPLHLRSYLTRIWRLIVSVFDQLPDLHFVGFSTWTSNYLTTLLAAAYLKRRQNAPYIVVGGPQVSQSKTAAHLGLRSGLFDSVVVGEGEQALLDLYSNFSAATRTVSQLVGGTMTLTPAGEITLEPRSLLKLKDLPLPDFDEMHLPAYSLGGKRVVTYQLSRGCTDKCAFCSEWVFWERFRLTKMDRAVQDVIELKKRWGAERIWFTDSLLNGSPRHLRDFAQGLVDHDVDIQWSGYMRAQIDAETAQLLHQSGCMWVFIGVESLDDETLLRMNKRRTVKENLDAVQTFLDARIPVKVGLIPGFPGDTAERFTKTARRIREMVAKDRLLGVSHEAFIVLPGQPIYEDLEAFGLTPVPWQPEVIDLAPNYAEISRKSWCQVKGANQGRDRMGEYTLSLSLTGPAQPFDGDVDHWREKITPYDLDLTALERDVWLVRTIAPQGHTIGLLLTSREKDDLLAEPLTEIEPTPLCDTRHVGSRIRELLGLHTAAVSLDRPSVAVTRYRALSPSAEGAQVTLGPVTIARRIGNEFWLANLATGTFGGLVLENPVAEALLTGKELPLTATAVDLAAKALLSYATLPAQQALDNAPLPETDPSLAHPVPPSIAGGQVL